ncbi:hypothetical protein FOCC_FOCC016276 [Frankliniella occidentalis]|nr:hypothetical protein FOCC_FOCC016276 [Frankliniella occidentalis]
MSDLKILTVNARYVGSSHDSHVYNESGLDPVMEVAHREDRCWLLGDSGYAHLPWLMTPIENAAPETPEASFNMLQAKCRNPIERCKMAMPFSPTSLPTS